MQHPIAHARALHLSLLAGTVLAAAATPAAATTTQELDQRIRILERKLELEKEEATAKAATATVAAASDKGFSLKSGDYEFRVNGLIQLDGRWFTGDSVPQSADTFTFRRLRPTFQGTLGSLVGYRLTPEFAGNNATFVDAYIDLKFAPAVTLRAGKVKGPVGLERLQSASAIAFIERGLPTELAPNREIGVQLQGALAGNQLQYVVGVYNGTRDGEDGGATDNNGRKEVEARLFYEPTPGIGFGIAGSHGSKRGVPESPRNYSTPDRRTGISYAAGTNYDGDATRFSPQGYLYRGPFGLLAEYIVSTQELTSASDRGEISNEAWQLVASYVLTGEAASFGGVKPQTPFRVGKPGWGAFEITARIGALQADDEGVDIGVFEASGVESIQNAAIGLNWILNGNVKAVLNFNRTSFSNFSDPDRDDEKSVFTRLQLSF
ncbi:OprO/OprP family phosphate-selective porin [Sinimarinibacterium thermocellulolyticum]|uniref:Porin n=1 Tax=Sinimarinibacterium thermocellulolyticum TaxID=3170016 RepID=A0ABV2A911_9GAMM